MVKKDTTHYIKQIIDKINKCWNAQTICTRRGFRTETPNNPTQEHFRTICIYTNKKAHYKYPVSEAEYKEYRVQKLFHLGLKE